MQNKTHVIIGVSAAGLSAANKLRALDPQAQIICISDETEFPYNKCFLADYLAGSKEEHQVITATPELLAQKNIALMLGAGVEQIKPQDHSIVLADGRIIAYDKLFIATGCSPIMPAIERIDTLPGIFLFHTLQHANQIKEFIAAHAPKSAVVIGAGLSGLECADALAVQGIQVAVVERGGQLLNRHVDGEGCQVIENYMTKAGIIFHKNASVSKITGDQGIGKNVLISTGEILAADMVIVAIGARPNSQLAQKAGISMQGNHILVDDTLQTSSPDIYAGGDVILVKDQLSGTLVPSCTWPDAMLQGLTGAFAMVGQSRTYPGALVVTSSAFFGVKFATCGPVALSDEMESDYEVIVNRGPGFYHKFLLKDDFLRGFLLIGATSNLGIYRRALLTQQKIDRSLVTPF